MRLLPLVGLLLLLPQLLFAASAATQPDSLTMPVLKMLGALAVVIGLLLLFYAASRRGFGLVPKARGGKIEMLETRPLGAKKYLSLVKVHDRELLLGISNEGIACLAEFASEGSGFSAALASADPQLVNSKGPR